MRRTRVLDQQDYDRVVRLLDQDPVRHCFVTSRLDQGLLVPGGLSYLLGYPAHDPYAFLYVGTNLVPVNVDAEARAAFVETLGQWRNFVAIVGPSDEVLPLWQELSVRWGVAYAHPRVIRPRQLLMVRSAPSRIPPHPQLAPAQMDHFESYFSAAAAMYAEELLEDPLVTNPVGYRTYVQSLVHEGRAFAIVEDGAVVFKADVGAISPKVAQIQGVWVRPGWRGRGLASGGMAGITNAVLNAGRIASLYVNDFNAAAVGAYRHCGYDEVGVFSSVLY